MSHSMTLAIIAAIARNRVIGAAGKLPWHIPEDLKRFKRLTTGHTVLMGRKTYESIGKPLVNRRNVVVSSRKLHDVECHTSIEEALDAVRNEEKVFVIGGAHLYRKLLYKAEMLHLTFVLQDVPGDVLFPPYEQLLSTVFEEISREEHNGFVFADYRRRPRL